MWGVRGCRWWGEVGMRVVWGWVWCGGGGGVEEEEGWKRGWCGEVGGAGVGVGVSGFGGLRRYRVFSGL